MKWRWMVARCVWDDTTKLSQYRRYQSWESYIGEYAEQAKSIYIYIVAINRRQRFQSDNSVNKKLDECDNIQPI